MLRAVARAVIFGGVARGGRRQLGRGRALHPGRPLDDRPRDLTVQLRHLRGQAVHPEVIRGGQPEAADLAAAVLLHGSQSSV